MNVCATAAIERLDPVGRDDRLGRKLEPARNGLAQVAVGLLRVHPGVLELLLDRVEGSGKRPEQVLVPVQLRDLVEAVLAPKLGQAGARAVGLEPDERRVARGCSSRSSSGGRGPHLEAGGQVDARRARPRRGPGGARRRAHPGSSTRPGRRRSARARGSPAAPGRQRRSRRRRRAGTRAGSRSRRRRRAGAWSAGRTDAPSRAPERRRGSRRRPATASVGCPSAIAAPSAAGQA